MSKVANLEDYRPHFAVSDPVDNKVHVIPVGLVTDIIDGKAALSECEDSMVRALLRHLLEVVADE